MATCQKCKEEYPDDRARLGFLTCSNCGDKEALTVQNDRKNQILPSHHKGGYTYVSPERQRELLLTASSRQPRLEGVDYSGAESKGKRFIDTPTERKRYVFSHFEWYFNKELGRREKRVVLKLKTQ